MASSKDFKNYIMEQLSSLHPIDCKPMMSEYYITREYYLVEYMTIDFSSNQMPII